MRKEVQTKADFAIQFEQLANRFDSITPEKFASPALLADQLEGYAIQAARLLAQTYRAGHLADERWVQSWLPYHLGASIDPSLTCGMTFGSHLDPVFRSEEERYQGLWTFAVGSWAEKSYPERMRHEAGELDWTHSDIRPDAKPIVHEVKDHTGQTTEQFGNWPDDALVCREALFDEKQAIARQCARAAVYADACRLIAWCIRRDLAAPIPGRRPGRPAKKGPDKYDLVVREMIDNGDAERYCREWKTELLPRYADRLPASWDSDTLRKRVEREEKRRASKKPDNK